MIYIMLCYYRIIIRVVIAILSNLVKQLDTALPITHDLKRPFKTRRKIYAIDTYTEYFRDFEYFLVQKGEISHK